jgi:hypothetical protein
MEQIIPSPLLIINNSKLCLSNYINNKRLLDEILYHRCGLSQSLQKKGTGNREQGTGNREQGTGSK